MNLKSIAEPDLVRAAAREIIQQQRSLLPNLTAITVVLPNLHAANRMGHALAEAAALATLLLPQLTTLPRWADTVTLETQWLPESVRLSMLYQALREKDWFNESDLWAISSELAGLFDELSQNNLTLPSTVDQFTHQLEAAYGMRTNQPLHFEARLVHGLWQAMLEDQLQHAARVDRIRAYHMRLAYLAEHAATPLYVVGLNELSPAEKTFFEEYAKRQPVYLISEQTLTQHTIKANPVGSFLRLAWPEFNPEEDSQNHMQARAQNYIAAQPQSPIAEHFSLFAAQSLEQQASAIDTKIRTWLNQGVTSIGVVVQDRLVARRARALLERSKILVEDETGWTFSTTAASTVVMRWLEALNEYFHHENLLDLLKSPFIFSDWNIYDRKHTVHRFEQLLRRHNVTAGLENYFTLAQKQNATQVIKLLDRLSRAKSIWGNASARPLSTWLKNLMASMSILGIVEGLQRDEAGQQLLQLVAKLQQELETDYGRYNASEWRGWLSGQLEAATFRDESIQSPVVFTHLAGSRLRGFNAVIIAGADAVHLPSQNSQSAFFNQAVRNELGLPNIQDRLRNVESDLISLISNAQECFLTWQSQKEDEPNLASPYIERLQTFHQLSYGATLTQYSAIQPGIPLVKYAAPIIPITPHPLPAIPSELIPSIISSSAYNSLMTCPYQFYSRYVLKLDESEAIEQPFEKRDYGEQVHRILHRFHKLYPYLSDHSPAILTKELTNVAAEEFAPAAQMHYFNHAWFLKWEALIPAYLNWQLKREAQGWHWHASEVEKQRSIMLPNGHSLILKGRLDRIDIQEPSNADGPRYAVIDYKTQNVTKLRQKVQNPGEDVQLPFYALLCDVPITEAMYLSLEDPVQPIPPPQDINMLAQQLLGRLIDIFTQLHEGQPLPAHGNPLSACVYCEMRGLCRRDHCQQSVRREMELDQ